MGCALLALTLSGCGWMPTRTVLVCPPVPETIRPILPPVTSEDLEPVTDNTYRRLLERERLRREYAEDLETILLTLRSKCNGGDR